MGSMTDPIPANKFFTKFSDFGKSCGKVEKKCLEYGVVDLRACVLLKIPTTKRPARHASNRCVILRT